MSAQTRIDELYNLLDALLARPSPGALAIGCVDAEVFYLIHVLARLDTASPADRILLTTEPFSTARDYVDSLLAQLAAAHAKIPLRSTDPAADLRAIITHLHADLPDGDHRLLLALSPIHVEDTAGFFALVEPLLVDPLPARMRLVIRDVCDSQIFTAFEKSPSDLRLAYRFHLPASVIVDDVRVAARDPSRSPGERASALLELAARDLVDGHHAAVIAACDAVLGLAPGDGLTAFALVLRADAMRAAGEHHKALASAEDALRRALTCHATPIIYHAAMTLGELSVDIGNVGDAIRCFSIAEHAAPANDESRSLARARRLTLAPETTC